MCNMEKVFTKAEFLLVQLNVLQCAFTNLRGETITTKSLNVLRNRQ